MSESASSSESSYLTDHSGKPSSMRLMSVISLFASIAFGLIVVLHEGAEGSRMIGVYITIAFLIGAFAPKALQKFAEAKFPVPSSS